MSGHEIQMGPCRNAVVEKGEVLVGCAHDGVAPFVVLSASLGGGTLRGMCAGCIADDDAAELERELARRREVLARVKDGPRDREWGFDSYPRDVDGASAWAAAQVWLDGYLHETRSNLLIWGSVGSGKTGLVWSIVKSLILEHGRSAQLVNWRNLLYDIRASFDLEPGQRREALHHYFSVPLLFLDDVGAEKPSEWASEQLSILVDERYMAGRVTGVTSNYALDLLGARLSPDGDTVVGERIMSRLVEDATKLEVNGKDRRL